MKKFSQIIVFSVVLFLAWTSCDINDKDRTFLQHKSQGKALYQQICAQCHGKKGRDPLKLSPPLAQRDFWKKDLQYAACVTKFGMDSNIVLRDTLYDVPMQAFKELNHYQIANILTYAGNSWGNAIGWVNPDSIEVLLRTCSTGK